MRGALKSSKSFNAEDRGGKLNPVGTAVAMKAMFFTTGHRGHREGLNWVKERLPKKTVRAVSRKDAKSAKRGYTFYMGGK